MVETVQILCFGDCKIGKSAFLQKYTGDEFSLGENSEDAC